MVTDEVQGVAAGKGRLVWFKFVARNQNPRPCCCTLGIKRTPERSSGRASGRAGRRTGKRGDAGAGADVEVKVGNASALKLARTLHFPTLVECCGPGEGRGTQGAAALRACVWHWREERVKRVCSRVSGRR